MESAFEYNHKRVQEIKKELAKMGCIALIWGIDTVLIIDEGLIEDEVLTEEPLTYKEAMEVLTRVESDHRADVSIIRQSIQFWIEEVKMRRR